MKTHLVLLAFCLCNTLSAQSNTAHLSTSEQEAYKQAEAQRASVAEWRNTYPLVRVFSSRQFQALPLVEQLEHEAYGHLIVYQGEELQLSDIFAYEQIKPQIRTRTYQEYKDYLYQLDPVAFEQRSKGGANRVRTSVYSQQISPEASAPIAPSPNLITRAQYNAMPVAKQQYVDAHPADYQIID
jgi:hypothetical protein